MVWIVSASIVINVSAFAAQLMMRRAAVEDGTEKAAERAVPVMVECIQPLCRVATGAYKDSWARCSYAEKGEDGISRAMVCSDKEYGPFLEYGTKYITADRAMRTGISMALPLVEEIYKDEISRALRGW